MDIKKEVGVEVEDRSHGLLCTQMLFRCDEVAVAFSPTYTPIKTHFNLNLYAHLSLKLQRHLHIQIHLKRNTLLYPPPAPHSPP